MAILRRVVALLTLHSLLLDIPGLKYRSARKIISAFHHSRKEAMAYALCMAVYEIDVWRHLTVDWDHMIAMRWIAAGISRL
jgi:hypothetical protein